MTTLPALPAAFRWSVEPWGHALVCAPLADVAQHLFTTRQLRLRTPEGESDDVAWTQAAASLNAGPEQVARVRQVHGRVVRVLKRGEMSPSAVGSRPEGDAMVSNDPDLVLAVQVADCVPILLADPTKNAVGAVHAGWRGTAANVTGATVQTMADVFESAPGDFVAAIGPSIGPCCYVVGATVREAFLAAGTRDEQLARWFSHDSANQLRLDLWTANRDQLVAAGVPEDRIHIADLCTKTHVDVFDSFRAEGERAGRMAGLIRGSGVPGF